MRRIKSVFIVALCMRGAFVSFGQEIPFHWGHDWGVGARTIGLGGAGSAAAVGYDALHANPAGLGLTKRTELSGAFSILYMDDHAGFMGTETSTGSTYTRLHQLGLVLPVPASRGSLVFALGYHRVRLFDNNMLVRQEVLSPYEETIENERQEQGALSNTSIGGSIEVAPGLYLGMGMHIWGGDNDYVWQFRELDEKNVYTFSDSTSIDHIATEFSGFHFSFGMLMVVREHLRIGATILSPVSLRASETWDFSETFTWDSGEQEPGPSGNGEQRYRLRFPWVFRGGAAASFGPILLTGDAELVNHTQIQYTTDPPESKWNKTQANLAIKHNFKDRVNYRLGIETGLPVPGFKLRGGYAFIPSPWKIASAGEHRKVYSAGLGFAFMERFGADLAFAVTQWERPGYDVIENETFEAKNILLSFTYSL